MRRPRLSALIRRQREKPFSPLQRRAPMCGELIKPKTPAALGEGPEQEPPPGGSPLLSRWPEGMEVAERESAGLASRPRVTSQHHVSSSLSEKLSSCLASPHRSWPAWPVPAHVAAAWGWRRGSSPPGWPCPCPVWGVPGCPGTAHPKVRGAGLAVSGGRRHGQGLAAWGCFPGDSQHSWQVSGGRRTPRQLSPPLASA